ncbi:GHKL domain-containing protein [Pontibacter sp. KCTC 32443]|uniref:sensor histidine kinase n=1 Tax=Pontibacter TaxID=323449 RepID=UPI00164DCBEA|nr:MULTISPECIES: ATP-binding protein [Pontibacter]MBC5772490.1 GHKL domain-containing protein [Pontibacter sp. KCTC 32443]
MVFNHFRVRLLVQVCLAMLSMVALIVVLFRTDWYITAFCLGVLLTLQLYGLIHFVERTNRDITSFLESIRQSDFTQRFPEKGGNPTFSHLYHSFNEISDSFLKIKAEKQAHYLYLQAIVEHIGIGILSFDESGNVLLLNHVAKEQLSLPHLTNIKALDRVSKQLLDVLQRITNNEKALVTLHHNHDQLLLSVHATVLVSQGKSIKIISLHNIQAELEEQEVQTWQKMIRVLTHEIMNSVTPVISLTSTVTGILEEEIKAKQAGCEFSDEALEDIQDGLKTIERRATGMLHFVKNYRRLMRLPLPELQDVSINELLRDVHTLMKPDFEKEHVALAVYLPTSDITLQADPEQLEQVLINLLKNAMEACRQSKAPQVEVVAYADDNNKYKVRIEVRDNGSGIPDDVLDRLFIPFYTTKRQGSGIGLSLSKQIMRQHGGSIRVNSKAGGPTVFTLQL